MEDDDVTNGSYFVPQEPKDQVIARKKEQAMALESIELLKDIVERLDERIAFYRSTEAIPDNLKTRPEEFMHLYSTYDLTAKTLESERSFIQDIIDTHKK